MVCADNTVVIPMRACDRGKSEARGARALKELLARIALWYMRGALTLLAMLGENVSGGVVLDNVVLL